jgi:hypothetical protein
MPFPIRPQLLELSVAGVAVKTIRELKPKGYHSVRLDTAPRHQISASARHVVDGCRAPPLTDEPTAGGSHLGRIIEAADVV